ncbi:hypothetical protein JCM3765_004642 [Sporobolomyces pararoseus]
MTSRSAAAESPPQTPLNSPSSLSDFGFSPAGSSSLDSPSTTYTTPSPRKGGEIREWDRFNVFDSVEESFKSPKGFVHLDKDYAREVGISDIARNFEWQLAPDSSDPSRQVLKRRLGPTEVSYYLGSRGQGLKGGVNDMYLHIGFRAPSELMSEERILKIWKTLLCRHTLLWSTVEFSSYYDIHFVNRIPRDEGEFEKIARSQLEFKTGVASKDILDTYLNGERTLSGERLSHLVISTPEGSIQSETSTVQEYDFFLYSTHFIGDGMALHSTANEFFTLLASEEFPIEPFAVSIDPCNLSVLPPALETRVVASEAWGKTAWSASKVDFERNEAKNLGGQTFRKAVRGTRHTLVPTVSYSLTDSEKILSTCKAHKSTIASALFALSNLAYIRSTPSDKLNKSLPTNIYSALNIRSSLVPNENENEKDEETDWYHLAIGYYNIILPSFYPIPREEISNYFWHQALSVKTQTSRIIKSRFLKSRTILMAFERERRSIGFEKVDEEEAEKKQKKKLQEGIRGLGISEEGVEFERTMRGEEREGKKDLEEEKEKKVEKGEEEKIPNVSLMGLSMLGNLDGTYEHFEYSKRGIELHTLTTGSRQRSGALLLFSYTFAGKLWISLGYDSNGFEEGIIENWWKELLGGVDELLLLKKRD